ncbi:MAG: serine hydroxymethyltransferase, partial [Flavobacteriales bacterium]
PFDTRSPFVTSGIRVGTPAVTTRGMIESDMEQLVAWMDEVIMNAEDEAVINKVGDAVKARMSQLPLFAEAVTA